MKGDAVLLSCWVRYSSTQPVTLTMAGQKMVVQGHAESAEAQQITVNWNITVTADRPVFGPFQCSISFDISENTSKSSATITATVIRTHVVSLFFH